MRRPQRCRRCLSSIIYPPKRPMTSKIVIKTANPWKMTCFVTFLPPTVFISDLRKRRIWKTTTNSAVYDIREIDHDLNYSKNLVPLVSCAFVLILKQVTPKYITVSCYWPQILSLYCTDSWVQAKVLFLPLLDQYSDKFMHSIVLYSNALRRSQLYCTVNLLLCGHNTVQSYA